MTFDVDALLRDPRCRILVCCGTGGVGKTTVSAALALRAAEAGRRVVLLTIDPAKRLATALGLAELRPVPEPVAGVDTAQGGSLDAHMLDMAHAFDEAIRAHAPADQVERLVSNPFYTALATSFSGTQDYLAMEQVGQLHRTLVDTGRWDLIVVDTPPSRSALDFLDSPARLNALFSSPLLTALAPMRGPLRLLGAGIGVAADLVGRIIGAQALSDLRVFLSAFEPVLDGFRQRAEQTRAVLGSAEAAFVVVATPQRAALEEAGYFIGRLHSDRLPFRGLVINQRHRLPVAPEWTPGPDTSAAGGVDEFQAWWQDARRRDHAEASTLAQHIPAGVGVVEAQQLGAEVSDLASLRGLGARLGAAQQDAP